jgi:hypothetical protein
MKLYWRIASFIVFTGVWWGVTIPALISARDNIYFGIGALCVLVYPVLTRIWFKNELKQLQTKLDNWMDGRK